MASLTNTRLRNVLKKVSTPKTGWLDVFPAVIGKADGTVFTGTSGEIFVRNILNGQVLSVYNSVAPNTWKQQVEVGRRVEQPNLWQVKSVRENFSIPAGSGLIPSHFNQHVVGGGDWDLFPRKQIGELTVFVADAVNFIVQVYGGAPRLGSGYARIEHEQLDLSTHIPATGALYVNIESDNDGTLSLHDGDAFGAPDITQVQYIPVPDVGKYRIASVLLFEGMELLLNDYILVPFPLESNPGNFQPLDADLTAIAALTPANDDIIQRKAGSWVNRTLSQLMTDLTELIQDLIGAMVSGNTETGIDVTYDDTNGKLDFVVTVSGGGHTIEDEGTPLTARSKLNFVGAGITATDDSGNDASVVTVNEQTIGDLIEGSTNKATPVDADRFGFWDSVADILKYATWANIKATLKTYFDTLYADIAHLTDTSDAHDASAISIADSGGLITATDVEGALAEIFSKKYAVPLASNALNGTIASGATQTLPFYSFGLTASAVNLLLTRAGKMKNLYLRLASAQPGTGSLVATLMVNNVASSLVLTIPAGSGSGTYPETSTEVTVSAGDLVRVDIKNNASASSAQIGAEVCDFIASPF